jgi:hypothetical protein
MDVAATYLPLGEIEMHAIDFSSLFWKTTFFYAVVASHMITAGFLPI